ncbi:MAG TPA: hypothetical protein VKR31_07195 [Rhizomicrobium sp.]|nr:hypothetical protein [Rhizomicrobium sp.]
MAKADLFSTTTAVPVSLPLEERARIEAEIQSNLDAAEGLIRHLDAADGDADLENDKADNEPSLGWTLSGACGGSDDREEECEDEGADYDALGLAI